MDKFVITGGAALRGEIPANGSKNSALPALAAGLLTDEAVTLHRVPRVRDIRTMERLLVDIGATVEVGAALGVIAAGAAKAAAQPVTVSAAVPATAKESELPPAPSAAKLLTENKLDAQSVSGTG